MLLEIIDDTSGSVLAKGTIEPSEAETVVSLITEHGVFTSEEKTVMWTSFDGNDRDRLVLQMGVA